MDFSSIARTKHEALDLAGLRLRQSGDELDLTRIEVAAEIGLDHLRDFFGQCVASLKARPQDDPRLDDLPAQDVSLTDDSCLSHCGMSQQSTFDLEWSDAVTGTLDHVAGATFEPEIPVLIATGEVAGH